MSEDNITTLKESEVEVIDVNDAEIVDIELEEVFASVDEANNALNHALLHNRDIQDQHPITAITGLRAELDEIESLKTVYSDEKQQADYYLWHDENTLLENRDGLFVSMHKAAEHNMLHSALCCIEICDGSQDVFGVTVAEAAFVGGQEYAQADGGTKIGRDRKYGLVVHSGLVGVRRETNVAVGDYVVPNIRGEAEKSDGDYGYLVTALSEVNGVPYAIISLVAPSTLAEKTADNVKDLSERVTSAEYNITSVTNVANSAYVLAKDAKENAEVSSEYIEEKIEEVLGRMDAADGVMGNLSESVNNACESAALAKAIAEGAVSSAEAMRSEAVATANSALNEAVNTRKELESEIEQINTGLDNTNLELQATKESIDLTKTELQGSIDNAVKDLEEIEQDLEPLAIWPEGSDVEDATGIAGFVARANEDSATLASMVTWKGDAGDSLAGFVQEATNENAEVKALAEYKYTDKNGVEHKSVAALDAYAKDNEASINLIAGVDGGLAGLHAQVDKNTASVTTLASHVIGDYVSMETWDEDKATTGTIYYAEDKKEYHYYNNGWKSTDKPYEAGLTGALAGIQQTADDNAASIEMITSLEGDFGTSLAGFVSETTAENAEIKSLAQYNDGAAGLIAQVDANMQSIEAIAGKNGSIAGLQAQVDENKSAVNLVSQRVGNTYTVVDSWDESGKEETVVYYAKDTKLYWYCDNGWKNTIDAYDAGLPAAVAGIQVETDDNSSKISQLTSWQGTTNTSMANLQQKADANGAYIQGFVSNINKYSYGPYSQAHRFTYEEALNILEEGTVYVPDANHSVDTYRMETYEGTDGYDKVECGFLKGYYYTWAIASNDANDNPKPKWIPSLSTAVTFSSAHIIGNDATPYWVVTEDITLDDGTVYEKDCLYKWDVRAIDGVEYKNWVKVASLQGNLSTVTTSIFKQTSNSIEAAVTNIRGDMAGLEARVDDTETSLRTVTTWKSTVEKDVSKIATIEQKTNDNTSSIALVVSEKDGEEVVNAASIVTAINDGESLITLDADHINFEAENYTIHADKINFEGSQFSSKMSQTYSTKDETAIAKQEAVKSANSNTDEKLKDYSTIEQTKSLIDQTPSSITLSVVSQTYSTKDELSDLEDRVKDAESSIAVNKDNIELKVAKDGVISSINQTSETITINANRLDLSGTLTVSAKEDFISSVAVLYARSSSATECTDDKLTTEWSTTAPEWVEGEYIWQKTMTTYADSTSESPHVEESTPTCIQGAKGEEAYTIILTNESHSFAGGINYAYAASASTQILAYKGGTPQTITINTVNGVSATMANTATGFPGLTFSCSATSGESPTITFTTTTNFTTKSCSIPIEITVDGKKFTKTFSCSIAFKGSRGNSAYSYWLNASNNVIHKDASGNTTPALITFDGKSKYGTNAITSYSGRWKVYYTTNGTSYSLFYTSSDNEASKTIQNNTTYDDNITINFSNYKAIKVEMYYSGGTSTLLDTQTIPIISDGDPGTSVTGVVTRYCISNSNTSVPSNTLNNSSSTATTVQSYGWYENFDTMFAKYKTLKNSTAWSGKNIYIWSQEKVTYSSGDPTYSTATVQSANSVIASWCSTSDTTKIDGGNIYTRTITSEQLNTNAIQSNNYNSGVEDSLIPEDGEYSQVGTFLNLENGNIYAPHFRLEDGVITADSVTLSGDITSDTFEDTEECESRTVNIFTTPISITKTSDNIYAAGVYYWYCTLTGKFSIPKSFVSIDNITFMSGTAMFNTPYCSNNIDYVPKFTWEVVDNSVEYEMNVAMGYIKQEFFTDDITCDFLTISFSVTGSAVRNFCTGAKIALAESPMVKFPYFSVNEQGEVNAASGFIGGIMIGSNSIETLNGGFKVSDNGFITSHQANISLLTSDYMLTKRINGVYEGSPFLNFDASSADYQTVVATASYEVIDTGWEGVLGIGVKLGTLNIIVNTTIPLINTRTFTVGYTYFVNESSYYYRSINVTVYAGKTQGTATTTYRYQNGLDLGYFHRVDNCSPSRYLEATGTSSPVLEIGGSVSPSKNGEFLFGTSDCRWKEVWCTQSSLNSTSDRNLKNSIEIIPDKYDMFYDHISPVRYKFNDGESGRYHIGFIAQEVKDALDKAEIDSGEFAGYLAFQKKDGTVEYGLRYGEFIALNTQQIQKLKAEVKQLKNELEEIKAQQNDYSSSNE